MEPYSSDDVRRKKRKIKTFKNIPVSTKHIFDDSFCVISEEERKVLLWFGRNYDDRSKSEKIKWIQEYCSQFEPEYALITVNEGEETSEFIKLLYSGFKEKEKSY